MRGLRLACARLSERRASPSITMALGGLRRSSRLQTAGRPQADVISEPTTATPLARNDRAKPRPAKREGADSARARRPQCSAGRKNAKRPASTVDEINREATSVGDTGDMPVVKVKKDGGESLLFRVSDTIVKGVLLSRPSKRNRAPYVGDLQLPCGRTAIVHIPSMSLGGKCLPGAVVIAKPARDKKGRLVGADAVSPKYGTPKCEFICQLVENLEPENGPDGCLIGAHPHLGEMVAKSLLGVGAVFPALSASKITGVRSEVSNVANCDMRADMVVEFADGSAAVVEVKTVVDTDYAPETAPVLSAAERRKRCVFVGPGDPYRRAGIFPWGQKSQLLDPGDKSSPKVVSTRAIKHVRELVRIASGDRKSSQYNNLSAAVLFVVARSDATCFRVNHEACPEFAKQAIIARDSGVKILANQVEFRVDPTGNGLSAHDLGLLHIDWSFERAMGP